MQIKTTLTQKDYINATMVLLYKKPGTIVITVIGVLFFVLTIVLIVMDSPGSSVKDFIAPICIMAALPVVSAITARRNYATNPRVGEQVEYVFDQDYLKVNGQSYNSQLSWDKIYKVTQSKNWIFIWHNRQMANPISKRDIWEEQQEELKRLLDLHRVKNKL